MLNDALQLRRFIPKKTATLTAVLLIPLLALSIPGVASEDTAGNKNENVEAVKQRLDEMSKSMASYTAAQKKKAIAVMEKSLDALDREVDEMEAWSTKHWSELSDSARKSRQDALRNLRKARTETAEWLGSLRYSTSETWDEVKIGFLKATEKLKGAYHDAIESVESDDNKKP